MNINLELFLFQTIHLTIDLGVNIILKLTLIQNKIDSLDVTTFEDETYRTQDNLLS